MPTQVQRMTLRQRAWLPFDVVRTFGEFSGVTSTQLRRALARLHEVDPAQPAVCALDRERKNWVALEAAEFAERLPDAVVDVEANSESPADVLTRSMLDLDCGDRPIVLGVCGGFVAMRSNHAIGDGSTIVRLFEWLIAEATSTTGGSAEIPVPASSRAPLARAAVRLYLRDPMRVVRTLAVKRTKTTSASDGMRPWSPARTFAFSRSDADLMLRLRKWRDTAWPGVSITSVVTAAIVAAFEQVRLPIDRAGLCVLVDGRRYLPTGSMPSGNFAVGQFVTPTDWSDPSAVHAAIHDVIDTGRPLPTIALGDLRGLLGRNATAVFAPTHPRVQISVSHLGSVDFLDHLPWSDCPDDRRLCIVSNPAGPEGITITSVEYAGALHLTASFHATTFSRELVGRALGLVCANPEDVLCGAPGQPDIAGRR